MHKLLDAPASQWGPLGQAMGQAFDARQALAWSADPAVAATLAQRHWDGAFPAPAGDFAYNAEFEYVAKNGRGLRRSYDHHVSINPDGSGRTTTTVTITNTEPPDPFGNASSLAYVTVYGPAGAVLDQGASDAFGFKEPTLAGHPAQGWFRAAPPSGGQVTLTVTWDVPAIATPGPNGVRSYDLAWRHLADHTGDTVHLSFDLPAGWSWRNGAPPAQFSLDQDFSGSWAISAK
jgi:hypothetical protein